jgi:predicted component of type VI protein secretion system
MEKLNRIYWKKGFIVTPESFIGTDNYHIAERITLGQFLSFRTYGILPNAHFYIEKALANNCVSVKKLECVAITQDGYLLNIQKNMPFEKEVKLNNIDSDFYVVLTANPLLPVAENYLEKYVEYSLEVAKTNERIECGIPILKITREHQSWMIDETYIPPAVALNSVEMLLKKYVDIKNMVNGIIAKIPDDYRLYAQLIMLKLELDNYSSQESPEEFALLLKKICWIFQSFLKSTKKIEELPVLTRFMQENYQHNEIEKTIHLGLKSLIEFNEMIELKPVVEAPQEYDEIKV